MKISVGINLQLLMNIEILNLTWFNLEHFVDSSNRGQRVSGISGWILSHRHASVVPQEAQLISARERGSGVRRAGRRRRVHRRHGRAPRQADPAPNPEHAQEAILPIVEERKLQLEEQPTYS
jgi:hypothetical protein